MIFTVFSNWNHFCWYESQSFRRLRPFLSAILCPVMLWDLLTLWPGDGGGGSPGSPAQGSPNTELLDGAKKSQPCSSWAATLSLSGCIRCPNPKCREKSWSCAGKTVAARAIGKEIKSLSAPQEAHIWNDQLDVYGIEAKTTQNLLQINVLLQQLYLSTPSEKNQASVTLVYNCKVTQSLNWSKFFQFGSVFLQQNLMDFPVYNMWELLLILFRFPEHSQQFLCFSCFSQSK